MKKIKNYDEIIIELNTLVILDIDNTIIKFNSMGKTWWKDRIEYYNRDNDIENSNKLVYDDWKSILDIETPELLDSNSFQDLIKRIELTNSKLMLLTARDISMNDITLNHLKECDIQIESDDVHYSYPKGKKVKELYEKFQSNKIIFVDDHLDNVEDVESKMKEYNIDCYLIDHENL